MKIEPADIRTELGQYEWRRATWMDEKLVACSPFRADHTPSFYVFLRDTPTAPAGSWGDSGTGDRGNFVRLIALLRGLSEDEAREYLKNQYGTEEVTEPLTVNIGTIGRPKPKPLDTSVLNRYKYRHPYLTCRGISEQVQRMMRVGYCREKRAVTIPWFGPKGELAALMYRKVSGKAFWFEKGGLPLRDLVYGIDVIYRRKINHAVLVEAPIDAMYVMTAGFPAIALGGANFSEGKSDVLRRSPLEEITIMADNDEAGQKWKEQAIDKLMGYMKVKVAEFPNKYKDANDIRCLDELIKYINEARDEKYGVYMKKAGHARRNVC